MTTTDLPARLLAAIADMEQRLGATRPFLLALCEASREIVEEYTAAVERLEIVEHRILREGHHDDRLQRERATRRSQAIALWPVLVSLARGYGLNPEENTA